MANDIEPNRDGLFLPITPFFALNLEISLFEIFG